MDDFFGRAGVKTLGLRRTFDFIVKSEWKPIVSKEDEGTIKESDDVTQADVNTTSNIVSKAENEVLEADVKDKKDEQQVFSPHEWDKLVQIVTGEVNAMLESEDSTGDDTNDEGVEGSYAKPDQDSKEVDDAVFAKSYFPRSLYELDDSFDRGAVNRYEGEDAGMLKYTTLADEEKSTTTKKVKISLPSQNGKEDLDEEDEEDEDDDSQSETDSDDESGDDDPTRRDENKPKGKKFEDKEAKKVSHFI